MTTPSAVNRILDSIRDRLEAAKRQADLSHKIAMNSYGAGYDRGVVDTLREIRNELLGD